MASPATSPIAVAVVETWWPAVLLASLAGVIHLGNAVGQLNKTCQRLIYFKPSRVASVYLWGIVEFVLPAIVCWKTLGLGENFPVTPASLFSAVGTGLAFTAIINGSTELGGYAIKIRPIHEAIVKLVYAAIARRETSRTALFWQNVNVELSKLVDADILSGLQHLRQYASNDVSLDDTTRAATIQAIDTTIALPLAARLPLVPNLLSVRRKDLAVALQQFNVPGSVITGLLA